MSKTAEEILRKHEPVLFDKDLGVHDMVTVICAMNEFAAQEVEEYKDRLRTAIMYADDDGSSIYREGMNSVLDLIDTVK